MTDVLAYNMFAHTRNPYNTHPPTLPRYPPAAPKLATAGGGPLYYRQHEVIQLIEVPAPIQQQHLSDITSSSVASSSYSDSSSTDSDESQSCSSYCSSDEEASEDSSHGYYDDTYNTRQKRVLAWRDTFSKAMGVTSTTAHPKPFAPRPIRSHCCSACDSDFATSQSLREHVQHSKLGDACRAAVEYGFES
ncbi:hypothetical protein BDY19DRAFT_964300 [Irpex rosettiformis]|uniref:Uncharacterized protein n=1 Tax=Irpex rosettiformis TaxID=378272 RepID=A0ACB8TUW8_9APHY|nr:hypothetical protein BDY19DRAFT_964300 [Irpex rosettiformis]